jgi:hypothetical protein
MIRRLFAGAAVGLLSLVALIGMAPPASAHSVSGVGATNWKTTLTSVAPVLPGLTVKVVENGSRVEVVNHGPEVLVFGYDGEPYLRIGPKGVFINTLSPAAYLNCSRAGCPVPDFASATAPPKWEQISTGQTILWHDHRTHWMGKQVPPDVARAPGVRHVQARWTVTMVRGAQSVTASGDYVWVPGSTAFPWLIVVVLLAAVGVVVARKHSWRLLAVATGVLVAVDFGHAVGVGWFWAGNSVFRITQLLEGSSYQIPGWILGVVAVKLLWRGYPRGRQAAACAGASALLFTGVLDFDVLSRPYGPFSGPATLDRLCVAICLGLGLGVLGGALALIRAERSKVEYEEGDGIEPVPATDAPTVTAPEPEPSTAR